MRFVFLAVCSKPLLFKGVLLLLANCLAQFDSPLSAQVSTSAASPAASRPDVLPRDAAELEIALGRIRLVPDRFRIVVRHDQFDWPGHAQPPIPPSNTSTTSTHVDSTRNSSATDKPCKRSLQVATHEGRPTLKLSYSSPDEQWYLSVDSQVGTEWTRELKENGSLVKVHYLQLNHQPIVIKIEGVQAKPIEIKAITLWHMTEQKVPEFEKFVLPALVRLNTTWDLPHALAAARRMRGYSDQFQSTANKHELAQSIAELDATDRRIREAAKQKLRDAGLAAQIPLEQLRGGPLTPQQRSTVEELLAELEPRSADTPTRLAYWLSGDPNWR